MRVRFPVVRRKLRFGRSDGLRAFTPSSPPSALACARASTGLYQR